MKSDDAVAIFVIVTCVAPAIIAILKVGIETIAEWLAE